MISRIDWDAGSRAASDELVELAGRHFFMLYREVVIAGKPDEDLSLVEAIALEAGEDASLAAAEGLLAAYESGGQPLRLTDFSAFLVIFSSRVVQRFREAICVELMANKDIALLAPTVVTLLRLPVELAALAVPISAMVARVGLSGLCAGTERAAQERKFLDEMLVLHRNNLRFVETERTRYAAGEVPPAIDEAIAHEQRRLAHFRRMLDEVGEPARRGE
ncbi:hypothetical protein ACIA5A_30700 [Micromonospora sp. NPDC051300]|uniref:hypothetical protein n=1 Tax=Micromonospora sp. NPDC051300 TaxID=3364286 RepID=UPI0037A8C5C9